MQSRLWLAGRPVLAVLGPALLGGFLAVEVPQLRNMSDRPACTETVMQAISSDRPVNGSYACFDSGFESRLQSAGVDSDKAFAAKLGQNGEYHYLRKTADGGYVYEYDRPTTPHDKVRGTLSALGVFRISADIRRGDLARAWNENNNFKVAWNEITGAAQNPESAIFTFYLDGQGKITRVR